MKARMTMSQSALPMLGARRDQMFPTMTQADIDRLRRFGESKVYETGERIVRARPAVSFSPMSAGKLCRDMPSSRSNFCFSETNGHIAVTAAIGIDTLALGRGPQ